MVVIMYVIMFYADIEKMTSDNTCRQPRGPYAQAETWVETTAIKKMALGILIH